jgi:hypothetical protein
VCEREREMYVHTFEEWKKKWIDEFFERVVTNNKEKQ